jgi:hypothetical protein
MPLRGAGLAYRPFFNGPVAPTSGHHAYCRAMVVTVDIRAHRRKACSRLLFVVRALALRVHSHLAARTGIGYQMDSAANQFGAPDSVNQRGIFPLLVASGCPSHIRRISKQESDYENR